MDNTIYEYIKNGITINGDPVGGYQVFTIPTQHFDVIELSELTPERFKAEVEKQQKNIEMQNELLALAFGKRVEDGLFKDLFE